MPFVRYADDVIVHCKKEQEANRLLNAIWERLKSCHLKLNDDKTQIVICENFSKKM